MAAAARALLIFGAAWLAFAAQSSDDSADRTITRVVKLLQQMLDSSKTEADEERNMFGKYKCYCDKNEEDKKISIASLTEQTALLESQIDGLQSSSSLLSAQAAEDQANMAANEEARNTAQKVRDGENSEFVALETDYTAAITQMKQAISMLSAIGADQTLGAAADHNRTMRGYTPIALTSLRRAVKQALVAASAFVAKKKVQTVESFLQAPFTGTYTAQSGEVVGILKQMRDTFTANLASARAAEAAAAEAHARYIQTMLEAHGALAASYEQKQDSLGANDEALSDERSQLSIAESQRSADEAFLAQLVDMCAAKAKDYDERNLLRKDEQAAIAEAISILNSDAAFQTFGTVSATSTGATSFVQRLAIKRHEPGAQANDINARRQKTEKFLQRASEQHESAFLSKVMSLLVAGNPFTVVLEEIQKMLALIAEEDKADSDQLDWCSTEQTTNNNNLNSKKSEIGSLNTDISTLKNTINNPTTGLKFQISETEASLETNSASQKTETAQRVEAAVLYKEDIKNLVEAKGLLSNAISVLERYYAKIIKADSASMLQGKREPEPPATWENDSYKGQSEKGTGAITMLKDILVDTEKEEAVAHKDERDAQHAYEDSMASLKEQERNLQNGLATLQKNLAEAELSLVEKEADLKSTTAAKEAIEAYLLKIKPGCDFIQTNIALRQSNRAEEATALNRASDLLKESPAYMTAIAAAHNETLGDCLGVCAGNEPHVDCLACRAKVTVPGYCAGHPATLGC